MQPLNGVSNAVKTSRGGSRAHVRAGPPHDVFFVRNFWKAEWSMTTFPTACSRFLPAFCFSSSFFRRVMSAACSLARTSLRNGLSVSRAITLPAAAAWITTSVEWSSGQLNCMATGFAHHGQREKEWLVKEGWHTEHLTINVFLKPGDPLAADALGLRRVDDAADSIHRRLVDVQLQLDQPTLAPPRVFVVERGVSSPTLELVAEKKEWWGFNKDPRGKKGVGRTLHSSASRKSPRRAEPWEEHT